MRPFYLFLSLLCILVLTACGSEEEITPPTFSHIEVNGSGVPPFIFKDPGVTITGNINDFAATLVANSAVTGEVPVAVNSNDGSWSFPPLTPLTLKKEGAIVISFTASDQRGNINQLVLTVRYDATAPIVTAVTQSLVGDPAVPQLTITFSEALAVLPLTAPFAVDGSTVSDPTLDPSTPKIVTLTLGAALPPGPYTLTSNGVTDLAGNSVAAFDFTIP